MFLNGTKEPDETIYGKGGLVLAHGLKAPSP